MKIYFAIPSYRGIESLDFLDALEATVKLCEERGHQHVVSILSGCCYVQVARNELVKQFLDTDCDTLFFLDDDLTWKPEDALKLIEMADEVVAGVYPKKTAQEDYPVVIKTNPEHYPIGREDGCIEALFVATGFLRVKRSVIERLIEANPAQKYFKRVNGEPIDGYCDLFPQGVHEGQWVGEDFAFCRLWHALEGKIWISPNMDLTHWKGKEPFHGNYHKFLLHQPGGSEASRFHLGKASEIGGWLSLREAEWLAEQASKHTRIVELGSCYGRSTRAMADNTWGTIWAIDNWQGPQDVHWGTEKRATVKSEFLANLKEHIESGRVIPITADHAHVDEFETIPQPDMVFIDGDHSLEAVQRDIGIWKERLEPGGLICGHDSDWAAVKKAVRDMLPGAEVVERTALWFWHAPKEGSNGERESHLLESHARAGWRGEDGLQPGR